MRTMAVLLALAGLGAATFAAAAGPERVDILPGEGVLNATLYRPSGDGPFPAVIALHGCGSLADRSGSIVPHYQDWGERLAAAGFVVLFPDSHGSRGLRSQCRVREGTVRVRRERLADAHAARRWLQSQSWVAADRISLLGWSSGANTTLWAVRPRAQVRDGKPDFRSAVAFYPGCRRLRDQAWSARIPTLILIGTADDWTPASACQQMVAGARGPQCRRNDRHLSRRPSRLRPPQSRPACAHRARLHARRLRARPCRNRSRRARGCAQARAGVAHAVMSRRPAWFTFRTDCLVRSRRGRRGCAARGSAAAVLSPSATAPTRPSANSMSSRMPGLTAAAARAA